MSISALGQSVVSNNKKMRKSMVLVHTYILNIYSSVKQSVTDTDNDNVFWQDYISESEASFVESMQLYTDKTDVTLKAKGFDCIFCPRNASLFISLWA